MGNEDSGFGPSPRVGSAAPTTRSEGKNAYCPRCDVLVSASDIAAGVVCRSSAKAFGRGPCYFDDRAWGQPPGTAAEKLRGKPVGWVMSPDGWATAECGCKHAVVNSTYKPCPAHSQRSRP
jgi:hypothetical protein